MDDSDQFLLNRNELKEIVGVVLDQASSDWGWGENLDTGVMWVRINRLLEHNRTEL